MIGANRPDRARREAGDMIEVFFDCSSPWTYLAFANLRRLAAELEAEIRWRPILVGGIFNTINPSVYAQRADPVPAKARYMRKDLADWARHAGLRIVFPPSVFPVNSVKAMRGCIALEPQGKLMDFAAAAFEAYWGDDLDISQDDVLAEVCARAGVDGASLFEAIARPEIKDQLRANTEELIARGGFGSPSIFVGGDDMYFGNDRMPLIRDAVLRGR
jgi:2-hydroxychromene-2-carboxylate isomerase